MTEDYREEIEIRLRDLLRGDVCFFAWLCAVRALPFLGAEGNFDYWNNANDGDQRQTHLFAVLRAIDTAFAGTAADTAFAGTAADAATAGGVAATAAFATGVAATAAYAAAFAAFAATYDAVADAADDAATAFEAACETAGKRAIDMRRILYEDIARIETGNRAFQHDTAVYGDIWGNFVDALTAFDCEYWAHWYTHVFDKGFMLDDREREEIRARLSVPGEIQERGAAAVARYMAGLGTDAKRLNETRILILGDKGSGKSSLALRLNDPGCPMPDDNESTEGVDVIDWHIPAIGGQADSEVNVHIWDFAGHVITHAAHRCFMSERCLYILLIDGRSESRSAEYWLEQIRNYGGGSPVLILVNVRDKHRVELTGQTLKSEFPSIEGFYWADIKEGGEPLEAFRQIVMEHLRNNPLWKNQKISASAYRVKEALRQRFAQGGEFIERDDFTLIAKDNGVAPDKHRQLLEDLRDLGICLWYDNDDMRGFHSMVLNPSWISYGIYKLINGGMNEKKTTLSIADFLRVFKEDTVKYPVEKADFLFKLMKVYQLAFFKDTDKIFVPLLLPADRTEEKALPVFPFGERLRMEYRANQALPPYTAARLAVLHSDELDETLSWRFGALLQWEGTTALVEESERARTVSVYVKGPKRTEYISRLRDTLNSIFDDYRSSSPELKYEVLAIHIGVNRLDQHYRAFADHAKFMHSTDQIVGNAMLNQLLPTGDTQYPAVDPRATIQVYNIYIEPKGPVQIGGIGNTMDFSRKVTVNFQNCAANLQEELNALARSLRQSGDAEDAALADELRAAASDLAEMETLIPADMTPDSSEIEEVKTTLRKEGLLKRVKDLYDELRDENSDLHKKTAKIRKGVETLQTLGGHYNSVAQWVGLPQIPRPFLGE